CRPTARPSTLPPVSLEVFPGPVRWRDRWRSRPRLPGGTSKPPNISSAHPSSNTSSPSRGMSFPIPGWRDPAPADRSPPAFPSCHPAGSRASLLHSVEHYLGGSWGPPSMPRAGLVRRGSPDPAVGLTGGLHVTRRRSGTAVAEAGGSGSHCSNQLVQGQLSLVLNKRPAGKSRGLAVFAPRRLRSARLSRVPCRRPEIEAMRGRKRSTRRFAEPLNLRKTLRTFSPIPQFPQTRSFAMNFIGVDLHKKSITICVMDEKRKILARKTVACTQTDEIVEFFRQFRPFKVVVEATASYVWFVELVEPLAEKVVLANPKKLRVIAESTKKTDRLDAQVLTEFLVLDMIPESYQPTPRQRQHRALVRHRQYLQGRITSVRSKIRHILSNSNADRKDLFSAHCGPAYLKEGRLSDVDRLEIQQLWAEWQDHLAQRLAIIIPATKIRTNPYSRFAPATADRGSRGIRDQLRNPPKYTEKRIRINFPFPCPSRGQ